MKDLILRTIVILINLPVIALAQSNQNYIVSITPYQAISTPANSNDGNSNMSIQYFDGLGRIVENVQKGITPNGQDLVDLTEYDIIGRDSCKWNPTPASGNAGGYILKSAFSSLASNQYGSTESPYSKVEYESSPLNRLSGQYGAGAVWYANSKKISTSYQVNITDEVAYYCVNSNKQLQRNGNYLLNTLNKTVVTDEDGKITTEYKNKQGQVVMKRINSSSNVDTYYVYNDLGQLSYVLPPIAVDSLPSTGQITDDNGVLKRYAYLYKYDERGNNVVKRLPGCDSICMVYDKALRLVMSQDGNQRAKKNWIVTKYDALGRVIYTGMLNSASTRVQLKATYDNTVVIESYTNGTGYSCNNFCSATPLTINYYDSYDYLGLSIVTTADKASLPFVPLSGYDGQFLDKTTNQPNPKGLLTGTRTYILDKTGTYLTTAMYYDKYGRLVQTRASNHLGGYDITYNHYDFTGKVLKERKDHNISGQSVITEVYRYAYDKAERLTLTRYKLASKDTITLASNTYDELDRLVTNYRHNSTDTVSYAYNIRNWTILLKSGKFVENLFYNTNPINSNVCFNGNISFSNWTYNGAINSYNYVYDDLNRLSSATFYNTISVPGGNIYVSGPTGYESFNYDKQGNIINLSRNGIANSSPIDLLTYKYVGNQVKSISDQMTSQHLASVKEYQNLSTATNKIEFYYDKNGNMTSDSDRNIVAIRYNILNLPDTIQFGTGNQIINRYAADGRKLGTEYFTRVTNLAVPLITRQVINQTYSLNVINQNGTAYIDNKEYTTLNGNPALTAINRVHNAEGYTDNLLNPYGPFYYYDRKDHLGNIREVWRAAGFPPAGTVQYTQYYPSGLPWASNSIDNPITQPYKYNGKEFVEMNGYDTYDYGARGYYPAMGRFTGVDPLCEKYYSISPYAYCAGNPVSRIDPNGKEIINSADRVTYTEDDAKIAFTAIQRQNNNKSGFSIHFVMQERTPEIYKHTLNSFRLGKPDVLHYESDKKVQSQHRNQALKGIPSRGSEGLERDEYPYASTKEGGAGANVAYVPKGENGKQGADLGFLYKTMDDGDAFLVLPVPNENEPNPLPVNVPETSPRNKFLDYMKDKTGLTGAALITYIIISEATRVIPVRNVIPAP